MDKKQIIKYLESFKYDFQYYQEKAKEINFVETQIRTANNSDFLLETKKYEESQIAKFINKKKDIEMLLQKTSQPYQTLLYLKYISFLTFDQIADRMNYSTKRIYQLHSEALNTLLIIINKTKD